MSQILVVQQSCGLADQIGRVLSNHGHRVVVATSCRDADAIHEFFDVGIFDVRLPDGSGAHLAARLSGLGRVRSRIFYTAAPPGSISRYPMAGPVVRHGTPVEQLLAAVGDAVSKLEHENVQSRTMVRPTGPVPSVKGRFAGGGSGRS